MRSLGQLAALALELLLALAAPAYADMSGTYVGTGISQGTTLNLTQQGFNISGDFSGVLNGTFYGQTDGGDYAEGYLTESGTTYTYYLNWTPAQLTITIYDTMGNQLAYAFAPLQAGGITEPHQPTTTTTTTTRPTDDQRQFADLNFHVYLNGVQSGPFPLDQMIGKIQSGEIARDTLVWMEGLPEWVPAENINLLAEAFPPPPPAVVTYYALIDGQQAGPLASDAVMAEIDAGRIVQETLMWTAGMADWAPAETFEEFAEALAPAVPPPPPVPPTPPPVTPPPPPDQPPAPPAQPEIMVDPAALEAMVMRRLDSEIAGVSQDKVDLTVECLMGILLNLTVDEQAEMLAVDGIMPEDMMARFEAAHPGMDNGSEECVAMLRPAPPQPPQMPQQPRPPQPPAVDQAALETMIRQNMGVRVSGYTPPEMDALASCLMGVFSSFTPGEQQMMLDTSGRPSPEQEDALEAAHPGYKDQKEECVFPGRGSPTTPVAGGGDQPATTTTPSGDPLDTAIDNYVQRTGMMSASDEVASCMRGAFSVLTPDERQMVADSDLELSPSQAQALMTAHPGMMESMGACIENLGRPFGG